MGRRPNLVSVLPDGRAAPQYWVALFPVIEDAELTGCFSGLLQKRQVDGDAKVFEAVFPRIINNQAIARGAPSVKDWMAPPTVESSDGIPLDIDQLPPTCQAEGVVKALPETARSDSCGSQLRCKRTPIDQHEMRRGGIQHLSSNFRHRCCSLDAWQAVSSTPPLYLTLATTFTTGSVRDHASIRHRHVRDRQSTVLGSAVDRPLLSSGWPQGSLKPGSLPTVALTKCSTQIPVPIWGKHPASFPKIEKYVGCVEHVPSTA